MSRDTERMYLNTGDDPLFWHAPDAAGGVFGSIVPAPPLRGMVERIHFGHEWIDPATPLTERVLPDGGVHLIFNLGDAPTEPGSGGHAYEALGARCEPTLVRMAGRVEQVTVTLRPGGMASLLGLPAGELAGQTVALDALWGARAARVLEQVAAAAPGRPRALAMEAVLLGMAGGRADRTDPAAAEAVRIITRTRGRIRVRELAAALGVGERRLGQIFTRHVGLAPKAVCRIARFRATVNLLQHQPERAWTDVALECGFYDQSHLVNEFQALAGLAPGDFRDRGCGFFQDASAAAA
ncbi:helix-turn-helix domain-containing protein [Longimicrobium terrae]|uniref:AraC-like DNA-binding protein n=1 Tax=Longimicrobium terrae TaxID=1639882 RepID=A0A841GVF6_9BACT|nr:helix-turn-helix domain-containing protein [Longimicrobium terrae]MBB4634335.1 AraC-like DNA-binding protein [Longimicrobium terrae]MBB6068775.1 AraC-like DNA-binding protein [Longimicrobium terrae]NNC27959.1 AraC family transcriptional regulator [Longimicrobium terrae]